VEAVGTASRRMRRRSGRRRVCGGEMIGFGFRCLGTLKKMNSSDGYDDVINVHHISHNMIEQLDLFND
jgi:hypothetical protein